MTSQHMQRRIQGEARFVIHCANGILMPIVIPWGCVYRHYVKEPSERWRCLGAAVSYARTSSTIWVMRRAFSFCCWVIQVSRMSQASGISRCSRRASSSIERSSATTQP